MVLRFLEEHPDFVLEKPSVSFGRPAYGVDAVRIFPMDGGEGHFAARFRKIGSSVSCAEDYTYKPDKQIDAAAKKLYSELFSDEPGRFICVKDRVLMLPDILPVFSGLGVVRAGVEFGELKKNRIEPAHGIFMACKPENCRSVLDLSIDDSRVQAYLRGEEIEAESCKGYIAVSVEGVIVGFGKASNGVLKNKYPKGLRIHG